MGANQRGYQWRHNERVFGIVCIAIFRWNDRSHGLPYGGDGRSGLVHVYRVDKDWTRWQQLGQTIEGQVGDWSGWYVSLSADGKVISIGAPYNSNDNGIKSGQVRVYYMDDDSPSWM